MKKWWEPSLLKIDSMMDLVSARAEAISVLLLVNLAVLVSGVLLPLRIAEALPSFARQTGATCGQCHVQAFGPTPLTPEGREFKLRGYVTTSPNQPFAFPPISAMVLGSFTHIDKSQPGIAPEGLGANDHYTFDEASLFYAGRIWSHLGAFIQLTYDGVGDILALDQTDIRFANETTIAGNNIVYGISLNNNPTVQDLWNTTPAWGFPFERSPTALTPAAATLIDGGLGHQVGGATAYMMLNDIFYLEAGAYASLSQRVQRGLGTFADGENQIDGSAPYWRVVFQRYWDQKHYVSLGQYGLIANVFPRRDQSVGSNVFRDIGFDWTYQYFSDARQHIVEFKGTYIHENQDLSASQALGISANPTNKLDTFRVNAAYTYLQTYGLTLGYFRITGSPDAGLYPFSEDAGITGSRLNSPDSEGLIVEFNFIPFGKKGSFWAPWLNARFALQYTAYTKFNGASTNYDGFGRDAGDNNTFLINGWLSF